MIFLDTSAIYALADGSDLNHGRALELFGHAIDADEAFLIHSYVLVESTALLQHRLGLDSALRFLQDVDGFQSHWVTAEDHAEAVVILRERRRRGLSLVDCVSFVVMGRYQVVDALAFDSDFEREGFVLYSGPTS